MTFYKHQKDFIRKGIDKAILVWGTGTGKSLAAVEWAIKHCAEGQWKNGGLIDNGVLVICPKHLQTKWKNEFVYHGNLVGGTAPQKINSALGAGRITIISKETFRRDWNKLPSFYTVIVDEAHYFGGMKSQMSKNLLAYIKKNKTEKILGLTATPYMSSPWNIYRLGQIMGKQWAYMSFKKRFFRDIKMGTRVVPVVRDDIEEPLADLIKEISDVVEMKDCVDLPDDVLETEYFELNSEQKKAIKTLVSLSPVVRYGQEHQICGGYLKGDAYNPDVEYPTDKLTRVMELIASNKKALVVCKYRGELEMISREVLNSTDQALAKKKIIVINGDVQDKQPLVDEANEAEDCVLLVSAACSEGWEAPTFSTMIFYSYDFSLKNYIQMKGRIQRINNIQKCNYISLVIKDSVDEGAYTSVVVDKMDFQVEIYKK